MIRSGGNPGTRVGMVDEIVKKSPLAANILASPVQLVKLPLGFQAGHLSCFFFSSREPKFKVGQKVVVVFYRGQR